MMSRTCWSATRSTPWIIASASASMTPPRARRAEHLDQLGAVPRPFLREAPQPAPGALLLRHRISLRTGPRCRCRASSARSRPSMRLASAARSWSKPSRCSVPWTIMCAQCARERLALLARLARDDRRADHEVAELPRPPASAAPGTTARWSASRGRASARSVRGFRGCRPRGCRARRPRPPAASSRPAAQGRRAGRPGPARAVAEHDVERH